MNMAPGDSESIYVQISRLRESVIQPSLDNLETWNEIVQLVEESVSLFKSISFFRRMLIFRALYIQNCLASFLYVLVTGNVGLTWS